MKSKSIVFLHLLLINTLVYLYSGQSKATHNFGFINEFNKHKVSIIDLNTYEQFNDLVERIEQLSCQDSIPTLKIQGKQVSKLIAFHNICWEEIGCILVKRRNKLKIINDSIQIDRKISLDSIDTYLKEHYLNVNDSYLFSEDPRKAMVSIEYENHSIGNLENVIDRITDSYSKLSIEIPLVLVLERPRPPAPPNFEK